MSLNIFTDMKSGDFRFDSALGIFVCLFTIAVVAVIAIYMVKNIPKAVRLKRELKTAKRVSALPDALTIEGEIVSIRSEQVSHWDIQYTATVVYAVGQRSFYGDLTFLNRGSLRAGQKLDILCDSDNPANSAAADGSQITALRKLISRQVRLLVLFTVLCVGFYLIFLGYLSGRLEPDGM